MHLQITVLRKTRRRDAEESLSFEHDDAGHRGGEQPSETAFLVPEGEEYRLRWFTPEIEVPRAVMQR